MYRPSSYWSSTLLDAVWTRPFRNSKNFLFTICIFPDGGPNAHPKVETKPANLWQPGPPKPPETRFTSTANR